MELYIDQGAPHEWYTSGTSSLFFHHQHQRAMRLVPCQHIYLSTFFFFFVTVQRRESNTSALKRWSSGRWWGCRLALKKSVRVSREWREYSRTQDGQSYIVSRATFLTTVRCMDYYGCLGGYELKINYICCGCSLMILMPLMAFWLITCVIAIIYIIYILYTACT